MTDRKTYEKDLQRRRDALLKQQDANWQPCLHDACQECAGTGRKANGSACIHGISCPCPKCSPMSMSPP